MLVGFATADQSDEATPAPSGRWRQRLFAALYWLGAPLYRVVSAAAFAGEWARWQDAALPMLPAAGLVLELGAGTGDLACRGARSERPWIALDLSPPMLRRRRPWPAAVLPVLADARRLPLPDAAVDAVVATFPAPFVLDPRCQAVIARVARPGAVLVVVWAGELAPHGLWRRLLRWLHTRFYGGRGLAAPAVAFPGFVQRQVILRTRHGAAVTTIAVRQAHAEQTARGTPAW